MVDVKNYYRINQSFVCDSCKEKVKTEPECFVLAGSTGMSLCQECAKDLSKKLNEVLEKK